MKPDPGVLLREALTFHGRTAWDALPDATRQEALAWIGAAWFRRTRRDRARQVARVVETRREPESGLTQASGWETSVWGGLLDP